ncbi:MAG: aspartate aminotransferase family protein [Microscillaceae bacterium]|jgi:acetylornithine aminotransferase|nr:aspartate aminotransferase family protein [Microscillaceae bacterium]
MKLFDVYPLFAIELARGEGAFVYDEQGKKYLDLYGGHAVISIGHSHPYFNQQLKNQLDKLIFYSNSIQNPIQEALAHKLGELSQYPDYQLFLCNSGAEANENALKLASFYTGKKKVIAFRKAFHGRTSGAVEATDNPKIQAPFNQNENVIFLPLNDISALTQTLENEAISAIIVEGIQGVGGIIVPQIEFLQALRHLSKQYNCVLILDEIQSGYGRSGRFFAHQHADIQADIITTAKGMGNGYPIGGVLIHPQFKATSGLLGTTFGGNHLASTAGLAVLEVIEQEQLMQNAQQVGDYLMNHLQKMPHIREVRGYGLMIGIEFDFDISQLRNSLLFDYQIFTGYAGTSVLRLLPPITLTEAEADIFLSALQKLLV